MTMKRSILTLVLLAICGLAFAQLQTAPQWNRVLSDTPETFRTQLISSTENSIKVNVQVPGFYTTSVTTPRGEAKIISMPKAVSTAKAGEPNVPMTGIPAIIGDQARMNIRVLDAQYMDFEGIEVAPSKGDFPRTVDPATVPYTYGECYSQDAFFPATNVGLYEPYIVRDFRGQNMVVYPYAYNPATKTLRVYYNMTVEMYKVSNVGMNVMPTRRSNTIKMDPDFKSVYQRHFVNYEAAMNRYTALNEEGDLLIICYDNFISSMTDFVNWKKTRGVNTTIVGTTTAGSSYSAIKTYIQNQYNANNNLTHVLLVGDVAQIPGYSYSGGGSSYSGLGDNAYGQIVGSDNYNDVFIGRFSAQTAAQVTTQVNRVITYERDLTTSATWLQNADGISRNEGGSGHNGEDDYQHMDVIRTDLLNYGYNTVYQDYENLSGYTGTASSISSHINSGVGIVNYCNHGNNQLWGVASYSNTQVNQLTNSNKLPFIFSVACLVGKYDNTSTSYGSNYTIGQNNDCFAEAWMHATYSSSDLTPTGAIGTLMSYISQPWIPPMWAQDECIDILVGLSTSGGTKHTWGGVSINGLFGIFDNYGTDQSAVGTYQAWILYGDPSMMVRTKTPTAMTVTHSGSLPLGSNSYSVSVTNGNGAVATITDASHNILGKATVSNGSATVNISGDLTPNQELTLCVFGFNKVTYLGTITVTGGTQYNITVTQPQHGTISAPAQAYAGATVTLTATPETGYCLSSWTVKKGNTNITVTNNQFTMPEGDVTVTATFVQGLAITLAPVTNGSISADPMYALQGNTVNLTATPASGFNFDSWIVYKTGDVSTTVTVSGNSFTMPNYHVTVCAVFLAPAGGDVTIGSGTSTNSYIPTYTYYNYSLTQQIFTSTEVGDAGTITAIAFKVANSKPADRTIDVYLSHTSTSSFSGTSAWIAQSTSYRVFSGSVSFLSSGWTTITLDTPFEYNGTSNLLLTVDDNTGSYITGSSNNPSFYVYSTSGNRAIYKYNDYTDYNPASMTTSGTLLTTNNQVVFTKEVPSTDGYLSVSPSSLTGFNTAAGTASTSQNIVVIGANLQANLTVTAPSGFEVSSAQNGTYNGTLTLTPSSGSIRANVYVRIKANANAGNLSGNLTLASGTTTATVSLSGTVTGSGTQYTITANANPTAGGTVSGAGTYYENGTCTLTATANTGYTFTQWQDGNTDNPRTITVTGNATYTANFTLNSYEVTASANPAMGGNITGTGTYDHGATATLTATAAEGYTFTNWTKNGVSVSTNATYSFTVTAATDLVANFTINSYSVTATADPAEGGTVAFGSKANREDLLYDFENGWQNWTTFQGSTTSPNSWMHNTEYVGYTSQGQINLSSAGNNSSSGFMLSESYISATTSGGTAYGAVTPDNYLVSPQIRLGGSITFYAAARMSSYPAEKFSVLVSESGNNNASYFTHTLLTVTLTSSTYGWNAYTVDLSDYSGMGYVAIRHYDCNDQHLLYIDDVTIVEGMDQSSANGNFNYGETCIVTATPNTDYHFVNWTENGTAVSASASYSFTVTADRDLVANFSQTLPSYTVTATANPTNGGTVTGGGTFESGQSCTLTATANTGYTFVNWTKNGTQVSTNASYTFTVNGSGDYVANFTLNSYEVTATANPADGGTISGAGTYNHGATATLTATAAEGYTFTNWTKNGTQVSTNATYSFTVTEAAALVANFTLNTYTITALVNPENAGTVTGAGTYSHGATVTLTATANEGYTFVNWTENGNVYCTNATCTSTAAGDRTLVANFEVTTATTTVTFTSGWNWWSGNLEATLAQLEEALGTSGEYITSQSGDMASYYAGFGWDDGELEGIDLSKMYKISVSAPVEVTLSAPAADPSEHPITINKGANWIGYPVQSGMDVNAALANLRPTRGDVIKSSGSMSMYSGNSWSGQLNTLEPGQGYVYTSKYNGTKTFTYPSAVRGGGMLRKNVTSEGNVYVPSRSEFRDNMSVVAKVAFGENTRVDEETEVVAFVGDECRGSSKLMYVEESGEYIAFLLVYGRDGEGVTFKVYADGETLDAAETLEMRMDAVVGDLEVPFELHKTGTVSLYPNPVMAGESVRVEVPAGVDLQGSRVEVYNALGILVSDETLTDVEAELNAMRVSGVYTVRVTDRKGNVHFGRLIVR